MTEPSERLKQFMKYTSAEVDNARDEAKAKGFNIIDFGVGDPTDKLYEGTIEGIRIGAEKHAHSGYPSYIGMKEFRDTAADWMHRRFGVEADPATQITSTAGSKEAVFHFPFVYINQGDSVLMPCIGYPPYKSGTVFAGGVPSYYSLKEENNFLPDISEIEDKFKENKRIKIMYVNYPNNPTTVMADVKFYKELVALAKKYNVVIASDEAYTEMYVDKKPHSILEVTDDWSNLIVFQTISKRSNATGVRVGFAVGGKDIINYYRKFRTQMDSGVANAIQEGFIYALKDESHVEKMRQSYNKKRDIITGTLKSAHIKYWAEATFYIWAKVPEDAITLSKKLLSADKKRKIGINVIPGKMQELGPGQDTSNYMRFALVPSLEDTKLASEVLKEVL